MTRKSIGGTLDMDAMAKLSGRDRHRPDDPELLAAEVRRLHQAEHSPRFIADALRLAPEMVAKVIAEVPPG